MNVSKTSKSTEFNLLDLKNLSIRTFWLTSVAFFLCFFAWFGIVPFMPDVVRELGLSPSQKWNSVVLAVSGTIFARLAIGKLCDKYGPRLCYTWLLVLGSVPVILLGMVQTPLQFLICRFLIGFIGASFVITQVHTSLMFAGNIIGRANATSAGWGNLGGGANRLGMPLLAAAVIGFGVAEAEAWRYAMMISGGVCFIMGIVYFFFTQDTPHGNFKEIRAAGISINTGKKDNVPLKEVLVDYRVWILFLVYAACFGMELTVYGTMDDYLQNTFDMKRISAGNLVLSFALMNIFARTLGGYFGDKFGALRGLKGRVWFLSTILMVEGMVLVCFSTVSALPVAIFFLVLFSLSVQMAEGATFSVVPFINGKALGTISGIVGAGGNAGAFLAALLLKYLSAGAESMAVASHQGMDQVVAQAAASSSAVSMGYLYLGVTVVVSGVLAFAIKFSYKDEKEAVKKTRSVIGSWATSNS